MNIKTMRSRTLGRLVLALALAGMVGGIAAAPARADDWRHDERVERHDREWHRHHHPVIVVPAPGYVVAPPVVYAPPPPPPGISLVFPFTFR